MQVDLASTSHNLTYARLGETLTNEIRAQPEQKCYRCLQNET
jgi:hypothetical protein